MTKNQIEEFEKQKKLMFDLTVEILEETDKTQSVLMTAENIEIPIEKINPSLDKIMAKANKLIAECSKKCAKIKSDLVKAKLYILKIKPYIENVNLEDVTEDKKVNEIIYDFEKIRLDFNKSMVELKIITLDLEKTIEYIR